MCYWLMSMNKEKVSKIIFQCCFQPINCKFELAAVFNLDKKCLAYSQKNSECLSTLETSKAT